MNTKKYRFLLVILLILWLAFVLAAFYIVQKPLFMQVASGLASTAWTILITLILIIESAGVGHWVLEKLRLRALTEAESLLLGTGLGLGMFGLTGFGLAASGIATPVVLLLLLGGLMAWLFFSKNLHAVAGDARALIHIWKESRLEAAAWIKWSVVVAFLLVFLLALAPPVEAYDALFYHLTVPALWLKDGGLQLVNLPLYWFPSLIEGEFVWPMALGSDSAPQLVHFTYCLLTILLLWSWVRRLWGNHTAWWVQALLLTMPSLLWLAPWAYNDLALSFYALAVLYAVWKWKDTDDNRWLALGGVMAGLSMGVKYTSFPIPLTGVLFIILWKWRDLRDTLFNILRFSGLAFVFAFPWYVRNWIWTSNPFYPFVFGGPFWDSFRDQSISHTGTGISWNLRELLLLPLNVTLGHRDVNFFDGRIGPFFLILFPVTLWALWLARQESSDRRSALMITTSFAALTAIIWTFGVIQTANLWQSRLLFPGLIAYVLVMAAAIEDIKQLDTRIIKISFILSTLMGMVVFANLLDFGLQVSYRNPLMAAAGVETRQEYMARLQPGYAEALALVEQVPSDAYVYFLYEPRSYGMSGQVQPDPINDNWAHDLYLYGSVDAVLKAWQAQGYSHILISREIANLSSETNPEQARQLGQMLNSLHLAESSSDGSYELYEIPNP